MDIITRAKWGAYPPRGGFLNAAWGRTAIVHHTAGEYVDPAKGRPGVRWRARRYLANRRVQAAIEAFDRRDTRVKDREAAAMRAIQRLHQAGNGWSDVGYHYVIFPSGRVYEGRPARTVGAHARNGNQHPGISFAGNYEEREPTALALTAFHELTGQLGVNRLIGHYAVPGNSTACPGRHLKHALNL